MDKSDELKSNAQLRYQAAGIPILFSGDARVGWSLLTKSISRLLSLLELGGQTALVRVYPAAEPSFYDAAGLPQGGASPSSSPVAWHAELYIHAGKLQHCAVYSQAGERWLVGQQALDFLGQMGGLSYELFPYPAVLDPPSPRAPTPPSPQQPPGYTDAQFVPEESSMRTSGERPGFPAGPPSPAASWRPVRTRWGESVVQDAQRLSRDERRVLSLINGQRTTEELARLLGFSYAALSELLAYFRDQNLIS